MTAAASASGPGALAGRRVVVVGASAGIGRAVAARAVAAGADVVVSARRREALDELVAEAGGGEPLPVDVTDAASRAAWADALLAGPPVDLVLVTAGSALLRPIADLDDAGWSTTMQTNLVGPMRLLAQARPALAPTGILAALSSESSRQPRHSLIPYAASKAGLEAALVGLRLECPGQRVSCVLVGATFPTEFGDRFSEGLGRAMRAWGHQGVFQQEMMATDDVATVLVDLYGTALCHPGVNVDEVVLRSPSPLQGFDPE